MLRAVGDTGDDVLEFEPFKLSAFVWDLPVTDILGNEVILKEVVKGARAVLFVNVATK